MKHAILILTKDIADELIELIRLFDDRFSIYIHIDGKTELDENKVNTLLKLVDEANVFQEYETNWGSRNIVSATLLLCIKAFNNEDNKWFHLISESDYPIVSNDDFFSIFSNDNVGYLDYFTLPHSQWFDGGLERLRYYHPLDLINIKTEKGYDRYSRFIEMQKEIGIDRPLLNIQYYGGSNWWSLPRTIIEYVVNNIHWNRLYESLYDTKIPDEIFMQTLLLNSPFKDRIINNNKRFILWQLKNGNYPAYLDETDYDSIINSNCIFARKINNDKSFKLKEKLRLNRSRLQ